MTDYVRYCGCNTLRHYNSREVERAVLHEIEQHGPVIPITVLGVGTFMVPRHYIALHGVKGADLSTLAEQYGWPLRA